MVKIFDKLKAKLQATGEQLLMAKKVGYEWGYEKGVGRARYVEIERERDRQRMEKR